MNEFAQIYQNQFDRVRKFALGRVKNYADAEDVAQDAFTELFKARGRYEFVNDGIGLLIQQAKWCLSNRWRQERIKCVPLEADIPYTRQHPDHLPGS